MHSRKIIKNNIGKKAMKTKRVIYRNAFWNKYVFNSVLKRVRESVRRMFSGSEFQRLGARMAKARSPFVT